VNGWTSRNRIVEIDHQERKEREGKNFTKRAKARWDQEFPESRRTAQNLIDSAKRFRKEGWGNRADHEEMLDLITLVNNIKQLSWTTEMKIDLVKMDQ